MRIKILNACVTQDSGVNGVTLFSAPQTLATNFRSCPVDAIIADRVMATSTNGTIITTAVTGTELGRLSGLTTAIQPLLTTSSILDVAELKKSKIQVETRLKQFSIQVGKI
jgi:hypothetical protein